jgi:deoxyhypusine synthase
VLGIVEQGHDYFLQVTDARPDTGGLSGATPAEAVSWGKVDPDKLPGTVVAYVDSTVALPILTAYSTTRHAKRPLKRLMKKLPECMETLVGEFRKAKAEFERPQRPVARRKSASGVAGEPNAKAKTAGGAPKQTKVAASKAPAAKKKGSK